MISKGELLHRLEEADSERYRWGSIYRLGDILPEADERIGFRSWIHEIGDGAAICLDALHVAEGVWLEIHERGKTHPTIDVKGIRVIVRDEPLPMICGRDITHQIVEGEYGPTVRRWMWEYLNDFYRLLLRSTENQWMMDQRCRGE